MSPGPVAASAASFGQLAGGATLSVLAPDVEVAGADGAFTTASDGMTVGPGDQVRTGDGGVALLTFFDGSETQLTPDSQVAIQQAAGATGGAQIGISQILGTTVDRVERLATNPTNFSTDTPSATAVVRGTRYTLTVKCYSGPPPLPPARLLTFPRRLADNPDLLVAEVVYNDGGMLWETRAWQDPATGQSFDTHQMIGTTYPEIADQVYQEDDGTYWLKRTWQDPATGATWDTYENVGVPGGDLTASSVAVAPLVAQAEPGCHPLTSVVLLEGRVDLEPKTGGLQPVIITPGDAGAVSDSATADSPLSQQGLQAFDQATSNLNDVAAARTAGQLSSQVADEFANAIVPSAPRGSGGPGGGTFLDGLAVRSATADSGLQGLLLPPAAPAVAPAAPAATANPVPPPPPPAPPVQPPSAPPAVAAVAPSTSRSSTSSSSSGSSLPPGTVGPNGGTVSLPDGSVQIVFPPGAVTQPTVIQIQPTSAPAAPTGQQVAGTSVELTASNANGPVSNFASNVQITMTYGGSAPEGMYFFNTGSSSWQRLGDSSVNTGNQTVTATSNHFTVFALLSQTPNLSATPTASATPSPVPSSTPTSTPSPVLSSTPTPTSSATPSSTSTPTATSSPTSTATLTPSPSPSPTPSSTPTSPTPSSTPTSTPSPMPTATATATALPTRTPTATPTRCPYPYENGDCRWWHWPP